ncbi:MAG: mechanosensitive ion channel domain-containing protein [Pseudomonadota bacterium]
MEEDGDDGSLIEQEVGEAASLVTSFVENAIAWLQDNIIGIASVYQLAALVVCFVLAFFLRRTTKRLLENLGADRSLGSLVQRLMRTVGSISLPVTAALGIWVSMAVLNAFGLPTNLLRLVGSLLNAYIVIRVASIFIPSAYWSAAFAWAAWSVAALNAVGLLDPVIGYMQRTGFTIGEVEITLWTVVKGLMVTALLIWGAFALSEVIQKRLDANEGLNPALRLLLSKVTRILLMVLAVVVGLTAVGVDLTAFAIFSGALGLGVGLGLQRTIANLVASFSILADRSLKPGDVIEVETVHGPTYGVVNNMTTRYVSVRTRDGTEALIPNEVLIVNPVTNWSYSDKTVRLKTQIGVSYASDLDRVIGLCLEAAATVDRVLKTPKPICLLVGFGDNSVDFELRFWIRDPENGVTNVKSAVLLEVWRRFKDADIEIPFPQRDLHLRSAEPEAARALAGLAPEAG